MADSFSMGVPTSILAAMQERQTSVEGSKNEYGKDAVVVLKGVAAEARAAGDGRGEPPSDQTVLLIRGEDEPINFVNNRGETIEWQNNKGEAITFVTQERASDRSPPGILDDGTWNDDGVWKDDAAIYPPTVTQKSLEDNIVVSRSLLDGNEARSYVSPVTAPIALTDSVTATDMVGSEVVRTAVTVAAQRWIIIRPTAEIKAKISSVSALLDEIISCAKGTNNPPDQQSLTEIERNQLIAMLETALNVLKSPMVEKGILKAASDGLKHAAKNAAQKQVEQGFGNLAEQGWKLLLELLKALG